MSEVVLVTHWVHPEVVEALTRFCEPVLPAGRDIPSRRELLESAPGATGVLVCMADHVDEEFLAAFPRLRVIGATLKGYDNIDLEACERRGIWLANLPDMLTSAAAELAIGLVIGLLRRVREADEHVRTGAFHGWRPEFYGASLNGSTVGLIGMGRLGRAIAERLRPFGAEVVYSDPQQMPVDEVRLDLDDLLASCDVVLPLIPLTPHTLRLLDARAIEGMRRGSYLVNVCRGSILDEEAVADALERGHLAGYAADVFAMEDWARPDRPETIPDRLLRHPSTLLTPHLGTAVDKLRRDMSLAAAEQVRQGLAGRRPEFAVNS